MVKARFVDAEFGRALAIALAEPFGDSRVLTGLDEQQLDQVYRWLIAQFPEEIAFETGVELRRARISRIRMLQESVLRRLADFGTDAAVTVLLRLSSDFPNRLSIIASLRAARIAVHAECMEPYVAGRPFIPAVEW